MNPDIFIQAFLARLLPMFQETTLIAIRHFKLEQYPASAALAAAGALLASAALYALGVWLRRLPERISTEEQRARIETMRLHAHFWLPYLLVLSPTPFGGIFTIAAGFFAIRPALVAAVVIGAEVVWRAMPYLR